MALFLLGTGVSEHRTAIKRQGVCFLPGNSDLGQHDARHEAWEF